jgi:hypothetical protein
MPVLQISEGGKLYEISDLYILCWSSLCYGGIMINAGKILLPVVFIFWNQDTSNTSYIHQPLNNIYLPIIFTAS